MSKLKLNNVEVITDENAKGIPELTDNVVFPSGHVVNSTVIRSSSAIQFTGSANWQYWYFYFNKKLSNAESYLIVHAQLLGFGAHSDYCGAYCIVDGANESDLSTDGSAYKGIGYMGANVAGDTFWLMVLKKFTGLNTGLQQMRFGWKTRNGSATDKWCVTWNPNRVSDARIHQETSIVLINEIKI